MADASNTIRIVVTVKPSAGLFIMFGGAILALGSVRKTIADVKEAAREVRNQQMLFPKS